MTTWNRGTSEALVITSITSFRPTVTCQTLVAHSAARVRWFAYEPCCLTVDTEMSHWKLAALLTPRISALSLRRHPGNWSESDQAQPLPNMTFSRSPAVSVTLLYK